MLNLWGNLQGPLAPLLDRNFGFLQFFLWFCGKTYHRVKFHLPRPSGSARTFCSTNRQTFTFIYIDSRFEGEASPPQGPMRDMSRAQYFRSASHFGRLRAQYCRSASHFGSFLKFENFPMLNLWGLEGPLAPPLDGNLGFSEFSLRFGGRPYPHAKLQVPWTPRSAQTFISVSQS